MFGICGVSAPKRVSEPLEDDLVLASRMESGSAKVEKRNYFCENSLKSWPMALSLVGMYGRSAASVSTGENGL